MFGGGMNEDENGGDRRRRPGRKIEILQGAMALLEGREGRLTTAALAHKVGVSEAALYRHFPNKQAILQGLAEYIGAHLLQPANQVMEREEPTEVQLGRVFKYHLTFFANHPGLCRLFLAERSLDETGAVAEYMAGVVAKYAAQIKQILRRGQVLEEVANNLHITAAAELMVGLVQSRVAQFVLSDFRQPPDKGWGEFWVLYSRAVFTHPRALDGDS